MQTLLLPAYSETMYQPQATPAGNVYSHAPCPCCRCSLREQIENDSVETV